MRMAAEFLNGKGRNLVDGLLKQPKDKQKAIRAGMADTLLRNIVLPRDAALVESGTRALEGLLDLGRSEATWHLSAPKSSSFWDSTTSIRTR